MVKTLLAIPLLASTAFAGEYAVLGSGFRIHVDRHQSEGNVVRLYSGDGVTEMAAASIARFEADEIAEKPPLPVAIPVPPVATPSPRALIEEAARKHGLPPELLHSVAAAESGYHVDALSPKGAIGLMQMMPATAKAYGADASVPEQNVDAGAQYLRDLLLKYQGGEDHQVSRALAAYNAGPGAVQRYDGVPPYQETRDYVARVIRDYTKRKTTSPKTPDRSSPPE